jgi:hypothetical protein
MHGGGGRADGPSAFVKQPDPGEELDRVLDRGSGLMYGGRECRDGFAVVGRGGEQRKEYGALHVALVFD